jgi:hypothetical protein
MTMKVALFLLLFGSFWQISNPPAVTMFQTNIGSANASVAITQNTVACWGFYLPYSMTTSAFSYDVNTADNTANSYDVAISDAVTGALKAHTGPTAGTSLFSATGAFSASWLAPVTLSPGKYLIAVTSSSATAAAKFGGTLTPSFQGSASACGSSTSATIPNPLNTVPSDSWINIAVPSFVLR